MPTGCNNVIYWSFLSSKYFGRIRHHPHHPHRTHDLRSGSQDQHPSTNWVQKTICCFLTSSALDDGRIRPKKTCRAKKTSVNYLVASSWHFTLFHDEDARSNNHRNSFHIHTQQLTKLPLPLLACEDDLTFNILKNTQGRSRTAPILAYYAAISNNSLPTFRDNLLVQSSRVKNPELWSLNIGPTRCTETSVKNYHYTMHNNPEERSSHLLGGGGSEV